MLRDKQHEAQIRGKAAAEKRAQIAKRKEKRRRNREKNKRRNVTKQTVEMALRRPIKANTFVRTVTIFEKPLLNTDVSSLLDSQLRHSL